MKVLAVTNMYPTLSEPWFGSFVKDQIETLRGARCSSRRLPFRRAARLASVCNRCEHRAQTRFRVRLRPATCALRAYRCRRARAAKGPDRRHLPWQRHGLRPLAGVGVMARRAACHASLCQHGWGAPPGLRERGRYFCWRGYRSLSAATGRRSPGRARLVNRRAVTSSYPVRGQIPARARAVDPVVREVRRRVPNVTPVSLEGFTRDEAVNVMNAVDVTLMTSDFEGSPVSIKESLACMTPVVSVRVGDLPELLAGLPGCAVVPRDPVALADAVLTAFECGRDPTLRRRAEAYSLRRTAARILEVYGSTGGN